MIFHNKDVKLKKVEEKVSRRIAGMGGPLMVVEVHIAKGGVGAAHSHSDHDQVGYIAKGKFKVTVGEEESILQAGDSFYAAKNVYHGVEALEDSIILDVFTPIREDFLE